MSAAAIFPFVHGRCQHEQSLPTLYPFVSLCVLDINDTRDAVHPARKGRPSLTRPSGSYSRALAKFGEVDTVPVSENNPFKIEKKYKNIRKKYSKN